MRAVFETCAIRGSRLRKSGIFRGPLTVLLCLVATASLALERVDFDVSGGNEDLTRGLRAASAVVTALNEDRTEGADVLGAALSDYRNLVERLFASGYYSGVVSIRVDGREAAEIPLLKTPDRVNVVAIRVDPGPRFQFGRVEIGPVPSGADLDLPRPGEVAASTRVRSGVGSVVDAWREAGHAKAAPDRQSIVADHPRQTLDVAVNIAPGPRVVIGALVLEEPSAVRESAIRRIAGLPRGEVFSPDKLSAVATRLRRVEAFSSVSLREAEEVGPEGELDVLVTLVDAKPRRFGFGAELSSFEGLELSGFWLHRNVRSRAEKLRFDASVSNIGGDGGGIDYFLGTRYEIPGAFGADTTVFGLAQLERLDEPTFTSDSLTLGIGAGRIYSERFEAELGINLEYSETTDALGSREFTYLTFPASGIWDVRDDALNPTRGAYLAAKATPLLGLDTSPSGLRTEIDGRVYRSLGPTDGVVLAGRLQLGALIGPGLTDARPDDLFFSGGGGTVRGQPFQSLNVDIGGGSEIGGRSFVGLAGEVRARITEQFGAVAFADAGYIGTESVFDGSGEWHSGAGLGLRYQTGIGPIRFDVGAPVTGDTGDGIQIYIGIGQAF